VTLTDLSIRNAKPKATVYRLRDGNAVTKGLGVTIAPAGSKTFFLAYTSPVNGERTQINLGRYPSVKLKKAREKAIAYRDLIAQRIDPKDEARREKEQQAAIAGRPTVEDLFDAYIADLEMDQKRSAPEVRRVFYKHIKPVIGASIAAEVSTDQILDVLTPIVRRGALVHADNVRAYLHAAFAFGLHANTSTRWRGRIPLFGLTANPVAATKKAMRRKPVGTRALSKEEVQRVWYGSGISPASHLAVKLLLATGQRVEEVLQATWDEFDLDEGRWTIPAKRRKGRDPTSEPHIVPLTDFHIKLLDEVRHTTAHAVWLFPHNDRKGPRKADALYQAVSRFCAANEIKPFAPRDCRRTFKTLAGSIGIDLELRNRLQGHAMTDIGSVHYDRWGYLPEKRAAMEKWTHWLEAIIKVSDDTH